MRNFRKKIFIFKVHATFENEKFAEILELDSQKSSISLHPTGYRVKTKFFVFETHLQRSKFLSFLISHDGQNTENTYMYIVQYGTFLTSVSLNFTIRIKILFFKSPVGKKIIINLIPWASHQPWRYSVPPCRGWTVDFLECICTLYFTYTVYINRCKKIYKNSVPNLQGCTVDFLEFMLSVL